MIELTWSKDWERVKAYCHGQPFAAIDPGNHGGVMVVDRKDQIVELAPLRSMPPATLAEVMNLFQAKTVVIESQYVRTNAKTSLTMGYRKGLYLGELSAHVDDLIVVHVTPSEWQSQVLPGVRGRKGLEKAARNVAEELLDQRGIIPGKMTKADLTGIHDAVCIGQWFRWNTDELEDEELGK